MIMNENWFEKNRLEQHECAKEIEGAGELVAVTAPVKSGKKDIVEILAIRNRITYKHLFLTSLNQRDAQEQLEELSGYGIEPLVVTRSLEGQRAIKRLKRLSATGQKAWVHIDEADYGSGTGQCMEEVFHTAQKTGARISLYSATAAEVVLSTNLQSLGLKEITFCPADTRRGASYFLGSDLIHEATKFYGDGITTQGHEAMRHFQDSGKAIAVVRICTKTKRKADYERFFEDRGTLNMLQNKYNCRVQRIDKDHAFNWKEDHYKAVGMFSETGQRTLLVINQTCKRSTEVGFHKHIAFWHDYRNPGTAYNTIAQGFRVMHYDEVGHPIRVYSQVDAWRYTAGLITREEYVSRGGVISPRVRGTSREVMRYELNVFDERPEAWDLVTKVMGKGAGIATTKQRTGANTIRWLGWLRGAEGNIVKASVGLKDAALALHVCGLGDNADDLARQRYADLIAEFPWVEGKYLVIAPTGKVEIESTLVTSDKSMYGSMVLV